MSLKQGRQYAADCQFLRRTIDSRRLEGPVVCLCEHPIRSGFDCVGPFIEELPTDCRLWEPKSVAVGVSVVRNP